MGPMERMQAKKDQFTPNELTIFEYIVNAPERVGNTSTSQLAALCGVSQPALTRFVKSLGYTRYQEFRADMIAWLSAQPAVEDQGWYGQLESLVSEMRQRLPESRMKQIAAWLQGFRRVYACGISKSFQPAELLEILSRKHSSRVHAVRQDFIAELCDYLDERDVLILFSASGKEDLLGYAAMTSARIMVVTANPTPPYRDQIDELVVLPCRKDPESSPVSPILFDIFVETLVRQAAGPVQE